MSDFDLAVIGAGPGGLEAALRARELGLKTALIEKKHPGGTCLNTGCIPTKALLASAVHGLQPASVQIDYAAMVRRKNEIVTRLREAARNQIQKSGLEWIEGEASLAGKGEIRIKAKTSSAIHARSILIATGSEPADLPGLVLDHRHVLSSTDILELEQIPKTLLIVGAGAVGVEFASLFHALGTKVTLVEILPAILPVEDPDCAKRLETLFSRSGMRILTETKITSLQIQKQVTAKLSTGEVLEVEKVLLAVGRKRVTERLGLEQAGVALKKNGSIEVNEYLETTAPGIFAIGDVIDSPQLAHVASHEGFCVAENLAGRKMKIDYSAIPSCVYSYPEVASVGVRFAEHATELVEAKIPFAAVAKAQIEGKTDGFFKLYAWKLTGKVAGASAVGAHVTELLPEVTLAVRLGLHVREISATVHAHPTESEVISLAARELLKRLEA